MRVRMVVLVAVVSLGLLGACSSSGGGDDTGDAPASKSHSSSATLAGSSWTLATYANADGAMVQAVPGSPATLGFEKGGQFSANTGCNQLSGTYDEAKPDLTFTPGPTTQMACTEPAASQEKAFVGLLPQTTTFDSTDDHLTLLSKGKTTMTFVPAQSLAGSQWKVTGVNTGTAVESNALTETMNASFGSDGGFGAFGGCNQLTGTYQSTGNDGLVVNLAAVTNKVCDPAVMTLEKQFTDALSSTSTFKVSGNTLTLVDPKGTTQVTFTQ